MSPVFRICGCRGRLRSAPAGSGRGGSAGPGSMTIHRVGTGGARNHVSDLTSLGDFLQRRREALQPEDVGLPRGVRRRTAGLRREEVALLSHMSTDYYARLERGTGPTPSEQMLTALAQGLHLSLAERDHLFHLAGHRPPLRHSGTEHISPGMLRVLDRLDDTPAEIVTELGETLRQSRLGVALLGDATLRSGPARTIGYRWFTDASARAAYPPRSRRRSPACTPRVCASSSPPTAPGRAPPSWPTTCARAATTSPPCGSPTRSARDPRRSSASCIPRSAGSTCRARRFSTRTTPTACSSTRAARQRERRETPTARGHRGRLRPLRGGSAISG